MTGRIVKTLADAEMQEGIQQIEWNATDEKEMLLMQEFIF